MKFRLLPEVTAAETREAATPILEHLMNRGGHLAIDTETTGLDNYRDRVLFFSMATESARYCFPAELLYFFDPLFQRKDITWRFVNAKYDMHLLANHGIQLHGPKWDASVMDTLDDDTRPHGLKEMAYFLYQASWGDFKDLFLNPHTVSDMLGLDKKAFTAFKKLGVGDKLLYVYDENPFLVEDYASCDAYFTYQLCEDLYTRLANTPLPTADMLGFDGYRSLADYYSVIETPMTDCLWEQERTGLPVDLEYVKTVEVPLLKGIAKQEKLLQSLAGRLLNPNSTDQLREFLFGEGKHNLGLKAVKHTKSVDDSGKAKASTDEGALKILLERVTPNSKGHHFLDALLEFRSLNKLYGTYVKNIRDYIGPDGRLHCRLNQNGARTGRLSCVAEWTPIKTTRGTIRMDEVRVGDHVWTHKNRWRQVTHTINKGPGQMYDVRFSNGEVLTCTTDHKFLTCEGWQTLGEILEHLEEVGVRSGQPEGGSCELPLDGAANHGTDRLEAGDDVSQRLLCPSEAHARGRAEGVGASPLLAVQDRFQEPDEGQVQDGTSALEGAVRRGLRVPDLPAQRKATLRTPRRADGSPGAEGNPGGICRASHRQRPEEQRAGQLGASDARRSSYCALPSSEGLGVVTIEEVVSRGVHAVLDVTVEEDASYASCGVFSHNSANPNIQNIPAGDAYKIRGIFCAPDGWDLLDLDYPQIEFRIAAVMADAEPMMDAMRQGLDIHCSNAARMYGHTNELATYENILNAKALADANQKIEEWMKPLLGYRKGAKTVGLAVLYGEGVRAMARSLKISVDEASAIQSEFFNSNPEIAALVDFYIDYAYDTETTFTTLGRIRRLHRINNPYSRGIQAAEERQAPNTGIQGTGAEMIKLAMLRIWSSEDFRSLGGRLLAPVHDELLADCPEDTAEDALQCMKELMADPFKWGPIDYTYPVPITPDAQRGKRWSELH